MHFTSLRGKRGDIMSEDLLSEELIPDKKKKISLSFTEYKSFIYTVLFYSFGLFIGSYFYKITQFESLNNLLEAKSIDFLSLFFSSFCIYFSLFLLVMFLGFCMIGYPIINIIPTVIGISSGLRICYYLINYNLKGFGYSLIMIIPFSALLLTVIAYSIELSTRLSKNIYSLAKKDSTYDSIDIKKYIKKYLFYSLLILITAALNSAITCLLYSVVTI